MPTVQAVAEADTARPIAAPVVVDEGELGEVEEEVGTPSPPPSSRGEGQDAPPAGLPSIQDGERERGRGSESVAAIRVVVALRVLVAPSVCCPALCSCAVCGMDESSGCDKVHH